MLKLKRKYESSEFDELKEWTIVNTSDDGGYKHWSVSVWTGAGPWMNKYSVWADSEEEALEEVTDYCAEHEPGMVVHRDVVEREVKEYMADEIRKNPEEFGFTEDEVDRLTDDNLCETLRKKNIDLYWTLYEDVWNENAMYEQYYYANNPNFYLRAIDLAIKEWDSNYPSPEDVID